MIELGTLKIAWGLLGSREKREALGVLLIVILSALSATAMVASILPFLGVLSDPNRIYESGVLLWLYSHWNFESERSFLFFLGLGTIAVILVANAIQVLRVWVVTRFAMMRSHSISLNLLSNLLRQPYKFFLENNSGEMGTRILSETQQVVQQFFKPAAEGVAALFTVIALIALLLWVSPIVTLSILSVLTFVYGALLLGIRSRVNLLGQIRALSNTERFKIANEALGGVKDIRLLGREAAYLRKFQIPSEQMARAQAQVAVLSQVPQYIMQASVFVGLIILCLVLLDDDSQSGQNVMADILPTIGLMALAGQRLIPELSKVIRSLTLLTYGDAAVRSISNDLARIPSAEFLQRCIEKPIVLKSELVFDNVSYSYEHGQGGVRHVSLRIQAGEKIGVVGTTGAGKSTLANLLLGLIFPSEGRILVDGTTINQENVRCWQRSFGYVSQEIFLVDGSIRENIALGVPDSQIDYSRVEMAARSARIHEFIISELDKGYESEVGERGVRLSGGQRQRIGIARALYNQSELIILDEATSALDNVTEAEVMRSINDLPGDTTLIMIAHRLSTLRSCDRILVLDRGKIAAFAPWEELERGNPVFQELCLNSNL